MGSPLRVWAVDVSGYSLWVVDGLSKGESLIEASLSNSVEEQSKVKRYLREIDQIRSLAGKLLVRLVIAEARHDLHWHSLQFQTTKEGRPFLSSPLLDFDYNITHDGDWVAIAFQGSMQDRLERIAPKVGVDVMEIHLPQYENTVQDFVNTMDMTLTSNERQWILEEYTSDTFKTETEVPDKLDHRQYDQLKKLYTLWTYKEAFTKAKGLGLGYDFQRIEITKKGGKVSLTAAQKPERGLVICEVILSPGHSVKRKAGGGTGMDSLLVTVSRNEDGSAAHLKTMNAGQAQQEGFLRIWTMEYLVEAAKDAYSKG